MLWTIAVILIILWALGTIASYSARGLIRIVLVAALIVVIFQVIQGRRAV
jgi:hypothetical protein